MAQRTPEISVVVPSHDRPLRLRWLLNALAEQTLERGRWEVVVGHDSAGPETEELLHSHPLAADGTLRHVASAPGTAPPGRNRNAAWRIARAPVIAFTDDDCRPPEDWVANALAAAQANPGAIVQGATQKDPREANLLLAPHWTSQLIHPPTPWAECCNILYPRDVLEAAGGFEEDTYTGEDTDLALRCRAAGTPYVGAPEVLTYHAVLESSWWGAMKRRWRWKDLPVLFKRHPHLRKDLTFYVFWKRTHLWFPVAVLGAVRSFRNPLWGLLALPWVIHTMPQGRSNPRGRIRNVLELPDKAVGEAVEIAAVVSGAVKHRSPMV
ncbi:glycosyltransferase family 2 protein [Conexibacter sp. SYSU D00693]|uniref:glycosyltransferase n=1 Tax=Conexibacter sp. SYSU D00693 TaxID=2812560 RepID=UPI00196B13CE|nr:glycosyltransferase [Conexibacter sp. SYSU D00693]